MMAKLVAGGVTLRKQLDARFPRRDRSSDGWVGDSAHASRASDHNPDRLGWVHAIDLTEGFGKGRWRNGRNARALADQLVAYAASGLPGSDRVKNVVYENQVASGTYRSQWWKFRGSGYGHTQHIHVSFTSKAEKNGALWPLPILGKKLKTRRAWAKNLKAAK
jgi:hypothetical protein